MRNKEILVISSCTAKKQKMKDNKRPITAYTLDNREERAHIEKRLLELAYPAKDLYLGRQHILTMQGFELLKEVPGLNVDLFIYSAGYGLVHSEEPLIPYDVTFSKLTKREQKARGAFLGMPGKYIRLIKDYDLVVHLLGANYLNSLNLPPSLPTGPLLGFIGGRSARRLLPKQPNIYLFETNIGMCKSLHSTYNALKGAIFLELAKGIRKDPQMLESLIGESLLGKPKSGE